MAEETQETGQKEAPKAKAKANLVYGALLLHSAGKEISEGAVKKLVDAAGVSVDDTQIKALVAALEGVDIEDAISKAAVAAPVAAAPAAAPAAKEEPSEEEKEKKAEEAAAGLGALFG